MKVAPIGVALDHQGDDVRRCGLLGDNPGEIPQILSVAMRKSPLVAR